MVIYRFTYSWYLSRGNSGLLITPRIVYVHRVCACFVGLFVSLASVLQVKDTGKSRERVKPVELHSSRPTFQRGLFDRYMFLILLLFNLMHIHNKLT